MKNEDRIYSVHAILAGLIFLVAFGMNTGNSEAHGTSQIGSNIYLPVIQNNYQLISDDFDSPTLNPNWYWIREDPTHWSLQAVPGWLRIVTQEGDNWLDSGPNIKNILLQQVPQGWSSYDINTKLVFSPIVDWQSAGLIIFTDDDNYVKLFYGYHSGYGGRSVRLTSEMNAIGLETGVAVDAPTIYLKIAKRNNSYEGYYSTDNLLWMKVGEYTIGMTSPAVGLAASNGSPVYEEADANYDYFRLMRR